jgi:hypothetical protein
MSRPSKTKTKKLPASQEGESENICFTIMPFGGWFDTYYESIYRPAIEAAGLVPRRADDLYRPSAIVHDIWTLTKTATIVLAELSGKNPNVFYELGLAHAIARPAILVTQTMDDVPFDLRALRVIVYDRNRPDWGADLKNSIEASIREVLTSPTKSVLPSFLQIDDSHRLSVTAADKELIALRQDVDLLKRGAFSPVTSVLERRRFEEEMESEREMEKLTAALAYIKATKEAPILPSSPTSSETENDNAEADEPKQTDK